MVQPRGMGVALNPPPPMRTVRVNGWQVEAREFTRRELKENEAAGGNDFDYIVDEVINTVRDEGGNQFDPNDLAYDELQAIFVALVSFDPKSRRGLR